WGRLACGRRRWRTRWAPPLPRHRAAPLAGGRWPLRERCRRRRPPRRCGSHPGRPPWPTPRRGRPGRWPGSRLGRPIGGAPAPGAARLGLARSAGCRSHTRPSPPRHGSAIPRPRTSPAASGWTAALLALYCTRPMLPREPWRRTMPQSTYNGLLVIDKPTSVTSRDAVDVVQRWLPRGTRIGHTGTLDPLATGVLVLCVGAATRLAEFVQDMGKTYEAGLLLGARRDTDQSYWTLTPGPV